MRLPSVGHCDGMSINMTPMIDVVFQLLIYFLCTASFAMSEQILPTTLPPTGSAPTFTPPPEIQELELVRIALRQRGEDVLIDLNGQHCPDVVTLRERLRQLITIVSLPVVLDVSPEVELGHVINVYDTCLVVGLHDIHFTAPER